MVQNNFTITGLKRGRETINYKPENRFQPNSSGEGQKNVSLLTLILFNPIKVLIKLPCIILKKLPGRHGRKYPKVKKNIVVKFYGTAVPHAYDSQNCHPLLLKKSCCFAGIFY